ncbi:hypothetical protein MUK42_34262 [Musa troglodytarum]|uniref:Uncharacterized protein n=1 Tax=Musa troglodytarum TaxID=320322 RepID=A0A9E7E984_9LILI|nr:hypothetical protein MUK42_34262 [Musa troglodytarum]
MKKQLKADDYRRRTKPARILIHCSVFTKLKAQSGLDDHWLMQSRPYICRSSAFKVSADGTFP